MNELQQQKAIEALDKQKEAERKQARAFIYHLDAFSKLHYDGVFLPYKVLYDLIKQEDEGVFTEVMPNPFYPNPAMSRALAYGKPSYRGDTSKLPTTTITIDGLVLESPDEMADPEFAQEMKEYWDKIEAEKMDKEKWDYFYGRFLLPYDLSAFSDFDFWGMMPNDEEAKKIVDGLRAACLKAQADCRKHPEKFNFEPIPRLESHRDIFDVGYNYL